MYCDANLHRETKVGVTIEITWENNSFRQAMVSTYQVNFTTSRRNRYQSVKNNLVIKNYYDSFSMGFFHE